MSGQKYSLVSAMTAHALAMQGAVASTAMMMTQITDDALVLDLLHWPDVMFYNNDFLSERVLKNNSHPTLPPIHNIFRKYIEGVAEGDLLFSIKKN